VESKERKVCWRKIQGISNNKVLDLYTRVLTITAPERGPRLRYEDKDKIACASFQFLYRKLP